MTLFHDLPAVDMDIARTGSAQARHSNLQWYQKVLSANSLHILLQMIVAEVQLVSTPA